MARLLNLAVILSVLWCGLHLLEPAGTAPGLVDIAHAESLPGDYHDDGGDAGKVAHSGHHHCPVAPGLPAAGGVTARMICRVPVFASQAEALTSLAHAPPLQPPAA